MLACVILNELIFKDENMRFLWLLLGVFFMTNAIASNFAIISNAVKEGEKIPTQYSCKGEDISPRFEWSNAPDNTQSFALICADPDAPMGTWYHWVLFNIPKNTTKIEENTQPENSILGKNSWGKNIYNGPCPPPGQTHHYVFTLYALDTRLNLPNNADAKQVESAIKNHVLGSAKLTGLFSR